MTEYDDLLKPIKRNFKFGMINVMDRYWKADIGSFISLLLVALLIIGSFIFFCKNVRHIENIQDIAESVGVMGAAVTVFSKTIISLVKRKEILSFSDKIKRQYSESLNQHPEITNVFARQFSLITKLYSGVVLTLPVLYTAASLIGFEEPTLPILMEIPYLPVEGWPFFQIAYLIEISIMWVGCNLVVGIELFTFFYIQYVCCRIEILAAMIEHWNDKLNCSHNEIEVQNNNLLLEEIVRYHSSIKKNMADIKSIFSSILMATLLPNSIVICMCLTIIFVNPLPKIFSFIFYVLSQTFMYCYAGNLLLKQNDNLVEKVMLVDFYYLKVPERMAYMNLVQNACNPIELRSYFVTVDMTLFFKVVKFAYSAFSLMKSRM